MQLFILTGQDEKNGFQKTDGVIEHLIGKDRKGRLDSNLNVLSPGCHWYSYGLAGSSTICQIAPLTIPPSVKGKPSFHYVKRNIFGEKKCFQRAQALRPKDPSASLNVTWAVWLNVNSIKWPHSWYTHDTYEKRFLQKRRNQKKKKQKKNRSLQMQSMSEESLQRFTNFVLCLLLKLWSLVSVSSLGQI